MLHEDSQYTDYSDTSESLSFFFFFFSSFTELKTLNVKVAMLLDMLPAAEAVQTVSAGY